MLKPKALATLLSAIATLALAGPAAHATLHGFCQATDGTQKPGAGCGDNGITFTANSNPLSPFGFTSSPDRGNFADFELVQLIPNNAPGATLLNLVDIGHHTSITTPVTETLFSSTAWTSPGQKLTNYLGLTGAQANPLSALLSSTQTIDPGATGFFAYISDFGSGTFGAATDPYFTTTNLLPLGSILIAFTKNSSGDVTDTTANSSAILVPAPPIGHGLAGMLAVGGLLVGAGLLWRSDKRPSCGASIPV